MYLLLLPTQTEKPQITSPKPKTGLHSTSIPIGALYTLGIHSEKTAGYAKSWQAFAYKDIQVYVYCAATY